MKRTESLRHVAALAAISLLASCTTIENDVQAAESSENYTPIQLEEETPAIAFQEVMIKLAPGKRLGAHHGIRLLPYIWEESRATADRRFIEAAMDEFAKAGYVVLAPDIAGDAEFLIGASIIDLEYNTYSFIRGNYSSSKIMVEWELVERSSGEVVLTYAATGADEMGAGAGMAVNLGAFRMSTGALLANHDFVSVFLSRAAPRRYGSLSIRSSELEVEVFLDEENLGKLGPSPFRRIPVGTHKVELKAWGLYWAGEVRIAAGEMAQIEASPRACGSIRYSLQDGVSAEIEGESYHQSVVGKGTIAPVWEGTYALRAAGELYDPYAAEIVVERGKETAISPVLSYAEEYERRILIGLLEEAETQLFTASIFHSHEMYRLTAIQEQIRSSPHSYPDLKNRLELLIAKAEKQRARQDIKNPVNFSTEAAQLQFPSQNPAFLGILPYTRLSMFANLVDVDWFGLEHVDNYGLEYSSMNVHNIAGCSLPLGRRFGLQASLFNWLAGGGDLGNQYEAVMARTEDWGAQLSLGWAVSDWLAIGAGASVFAEITWFMASAGITVPPRSTIPRSALCLGGLFRNSNSTVIFDFLCGFSFGRQYLIQAQDFRNYLDSATPYAMGDSVALPLLLEGTLTMSFWGGRLFIVANQSNEIFVDQASFTGRLTPCFELWILRWLAVRGAVDLSIHKNADDTTFGSGGLGGIGFRSMRHGWALDLGASYRMDTIRSIPDVVIYRPPSLFASLSKDLMSKPRRR